MNGATLRVAAYLADPASGTYHDERSGNYEVWAVCQREGRAVRLGGCQTWVGEDALDAWARQLWQCFRELGPHVLDKKAIALGAAPDYVRAGVRRNPVTASH